MCGREGCNGTEMSRRSKIYGRCIEELESFDVSWRMGMIGLRFFKYPKE